MNLDQLIEKTNGSKYTLVVIAAIRARTITGGGSPRVKVPSHKPVVIALQEIAADKIAWERTKAGY